ILAMVAGPAPERAMLLVEINRSDGAGVFFHEVQSVAHPCKFSSDPRGHLVRERHPPRFRLVLTERAAHLVTGDIGRFACLLHGHVELDDTEEKLEKILVLRVAALHGDTKE